MKNIPDIHFTAKPLSSGNLQVKFYIHQGQKTSYGYLLTRSDCSEEEILDEIKKRLARRTESRLDLLRFTFKNHWKDDHQFFLYSA
ncbi:hypothetical protein SAMN05192553_104313 [Cyclobacterium xiamenense]|uniref:Uncharacterized protein n=1 Tax=Cyclobacterium xiamenense TaxID=1297121 RepID=A0A1H6Z8Z1_9BACT|nr:hypothetical protein [Cyclobacterium xiamenense]SEJ49951.1 hypothetical protein SAMN05192553_104313 [Cyclobacterium xiamenense]